DRLAERAEEGRSGAGWLKRKALDAGLRGGRRRLAALRAGARPGVLRGALSTRRARARLGLDRMNAPLSALAALAGETSDALGALGVVVRQCYGTAESSGLLTLEPADAVASGSVGCPVAATELRVGRDEELLGRGPQIARDALDADGWLHTNDLGALGEGSLVRLAGRSDDRIMTASGARVDADVVAAAFADARLVRRVIVTGDGRPSIGALLELDPGQLNAWAAERSVPFTGMLDLLEWPDLRRELEREVAAANDALDPETRVRQFRALPGPLVLQAELTGTRRLRRAAAVSLHAALVDEMYRS
ncbi:MAG: hypothetical protein ABJC79_09425, partial [Acidimicrobiia bacterium]